jgi:8-oxo-dGTP pyrophosphatase MutT (NUDIX family)
MASVRHFTATGFVVHHGSIALHWHPKVKAWLPPGGHIEPNEDPVQAVIREIEEEAGIKAEVIASGAALELDYPPQVPPPLTIMVEDISDPEQGDHQHIDMIYVCRLAGLPGPLNDGWRWVGKRALAEAAPLDLGDGRSIAPPEDVRLLAKRAFEVVGDLDSGED